MRLLSVIVPQVEWPSNHTINSGATSLPVPIKTWKSITKYHREVTIFKKLLLVTYESQGIPREHLPWLICRAALTSTSALQHYFKVCIMFLILLTDNHFGLALEFLGGFYSCGRKWWKQDIILNDQPPTHINRTLVVSQNWLVHFDK